ncbi:MAG: protein-L-isoaspartate(D-aspartate) O-methyltransferase [Siculibacillus sp.]|nr:protein-L-isoaspartate(D-aspartate) O-methyltransferase [Siculibacillus sp.]
MAGRYAAPLRRAEISLAEGDRVALARLVLALSQKGVHDRRILAAVEEIPRSLFVSAEWHDKALADRPVAIECGQTIDAPSALALMYQAAGIAPDHRVLEIGTGSGYGTAILASLAAKVYTVERFRTLGELAAERFATLHLDNVVASIHDGFEGFSRHAPYHRIVVDGAIEVPPRALLDQLAPQGVLIAAVGVAGSTQVLTRYVRRDKGLDIEPLGEVRRIALVAGRAAAL